MDKLVTYWLWRI